MEPVIKVPPDLRSEMLTGSKYVCIETSDGDGWEKPDDFCAQGLNQFLSDSYRGAPAKSWRMTSGVRLGFNKVGVFIHMNHHKRFFGLPRSRASPMLSRAMPEAVPFVASPSNIGGVDLTSGLLCKLASHMPSITDEMRHQVLMSTFKAADRNNNGQLSKPEMGSIMRRLIVTLSAPKLDEYFREADVDFDNAVNYEEFTRWLENNAPKSLQHQLKDSIKTEDDVVRAAFRVWDRNGDGVISKREIQGLLRHQMPNLTARQIRVLTDVMDTDDDGTIDYDEFIDFLFKRT